MADPARAMSKDDALAELQKLESDGLILLEEKAAPPNVPQPCVSLDGWDPAASARQDGNVAGVVVRYLASGTATSGAPSGGAAPDFLDPRNALALVRLCQWLSETYGVTDLYHLGITGGASDAQGVPRTDCHGQGRAVDLVGIQLPSEDGSPVKFTVWDDWGTAVTAATPSGDWPSGTGTAVSYRLDDPEADEWTRDFFRDLYGFVVSQWQDRSAGPDPDGNPTQIGEPSFVMNPDHPTSAPGTPHGREAHRNHLHLQIGPTGTA